MLKSKSALFISLLFAAKKIIDAWEIRELFFA